MKMEHSPLFDKMWGPEGNPLGSPFRLDETMREYEEIESETFEIIKGNYKTTIVCKFNSRGYLVSHTTHSEDLRETAVIMEHLIDELHLAYEEERYEDIPDLQIKINKCRDLQGGKPTF